jgi:hypothetical protein
MYQNEKGLHNCAEYAVVFWQQRGAIRAQNYTKIHIKTVG